jgi:hypothetical protein
MEVQRECQSLRQATAIGEMAESVELVSDCEDIREQKLATRNLARCHAAGRCEDSADVVLWP